MKQDPALSVIPAQAGIQNSKKGFPLDCPVSLIPVYSKYPGRAMTEKGLTCFICDQPGKNFIALKEDFALGRKRCQIVYC